MADNKVTIDFEVVGNAVKKIDEISKSIGNLQGDVSGGFAKVGGVFESAFSIFTKGAALTGAIYATKKALDVLFEAENVKSINNQFELFTKNARVGTETLRDGLIGAAGGLADDTDLLKVANKALIELGVSAAKLPEILTLARQVTATFGGDLIDNFEKISNAIGTGQVKMLKQLGLTVDVDKANKDYAASLGVTSDKLSQSAKQTALLNAVLEKGKTAFQGVDTDANQVQNAFQKIKVTLAQAAETAVLAFDKIAGPATAAALNGTNTLIGNLSETLRSNLGDGAAKAKIQLEELTNGLKSLYAVQERGQASASLSGNFVGVDQDIAKVRAEIDLLQESQRKLGTSSREAAASARVLQEEETKKAQQAEVARIASETAAENEKKLAADRLAASQQASKDEFTSRQEELAAQRDAEIISDEDYYAQKQATNLEQYEAQQKSLDDALLKKKISQDTYDQQALTNQRNLGIAQVKLDHERDQKLIAQRDSFLQLSSSLTRAQSKELQAIGKAAALTQIAIDTPKAVSGAFTFGSSIGGPVLGFALGAVAAAAEAALASQVLGVPLANGIDSVPGVGNIDNFPAILAPGERVVPKSTNNDLKDFLSGAGGMNETLRLIADRIINLENRFTVQIGERVIADEVRRGVESGRVVFA